MCGYKIWLWIDESYKRKEVNNMELDINLNDVVERPLLPVDKELTFAFRKCEMAIAKNANPKTGQREPYIACELMVLDQEWAGFDPPYVVFHNFSLSPGALSSPDATFSIKKFFEVIGHKIAPNGKFSTEEVATLRFVGKLSSDKDRPNRRNLTAVLRGA
jgi:hypothetical protein